jgi:hypothetical protein
MAMPTMPAQKPHRRAQTVRTGFSRRSMAAASFTAAPRQQLRCSSSAPPRVSLSLRTGATTTHSWTGPAWTRPTSGSRSALALVACALDPGLRAWRSQDS